MSADSKEPENKSEIALYLTEDGRTRVECRFDQENVWLTQALMSELFQTTVPNINLHIKNILAEGELLEAATIKDYLIVRSEGGRRVQRPVKHYNLEMILAVGYRVRSPRGTQFRQWATNRLKEYLVKGFVMDDEYLANSELLLKEEMQTELVKAVEKALAPTQQELAGVAEKPDVAAVVAKTTSLVVEQNINIPRISVVPKGEVTSGFNAFKLATGTINYQPVERDILIQYLRDHQQVTLAAVGSGQTELRVENYLVRALVDFDDVSYDNHADLLYDLAGQIVAHLQTYLKDESEVQNALQYYHRQLADFVHAQMQSHHWEKATGHEVVVRKGFSALKPLAFTAQADEAILDFRAPVADKTRIVQMIFGGFKKCLYTVQKFQSDSERVLSVILDRESEKWFKPVRGQFQIVYKWVADQREYQPDFVAETAECIYMLEPKARNDIQDPEVVAKKESAVRWCQHATEHSTKNGGKPWKYLLIPISGVKMHRRFGFSFDIDG